MADQIHIHLMYAPSAEGPERFFELRRCGNQIWTAEGNVHTFGEDKLIDCRDADDAGNVAARIIAEKSSEGFAQARSLACAAGDFDYAGFTAEVAGGLENFWRNLMVRHPSLPIDRLALATDGGVMSLSGHAHVSTPDDDEETLYIPQECTYSETGELDIAYRLLLSKHRDIPFETNLQNHNDNILECMIRALEQLRTIPLFGNEVMLWVSISDSEQVAGMFERLNTKAQADELDNFHADDPGWELETTI